MFDFKETIHDTNLVKVSIVNTEKTKQAIDTKRDTKKANVIYKQGPKLDSRQNASLPGTSAHVTKFVLDILGSTMLSTIQNWLYSTACSKTSGLIAEQVVVGEVISKGKAQTRTQVHYKTQPLQLDELRHPY